MQTINEVPTTWRDNAMLKLKNRPSALDLKQIANAIGVSIHWLRMFQRGQIPDPGVCKIEALTTYLDNYKA